MAPTRGRRRKEYDVVVQGQSAEKVAAEIASHVMAKGFCSVDPRLDDEMLRQGREDIGGADAQGLLKQPPAMVHEGLLGEEGSSMILDLHQEGITESVREFRHLRQLDSALSELVSVLQLSMGQLSFGSLSKTHGLLHETGMAPEHAPDPSEHEASYWLGTLAQKKLMILLCLGPVRGTLELQPYDEEAETYEVPTIPGSFIILRADGMWHRHCANSKAYILSCFLVGSENRKGSNWVPPCAKPLEQWTVERMRYLKESQAKTQERLDLPAGWITAMNHMFHTAQRVAVRSIAARYAGSWNVHSWYLSQPSGPDLVTEVPLSRWDVDVYFDAEESEWRRGKSMARHGSFVEGTEYFDNKFFGLSVMEAKGMDPHQRVVLEVGYEACHHAGYSKGKMMNKIGGVYLGSSATIFGMVSEVSGATGGAASINSNRFSFCLGLKGPSMTCDTDGSSSLTAVHLGGEAVLAKGHGVSNEFSLAGGVAFQLGPVYLPQMQAAGLLGGLGRCFTWDVSAQGYTLGDGCGFILQKRMADWVDGRQVLIEGEPLVAQICGSSCATIGMGAAMSAPHGPSEQELVAQTLKTAMLDPLNIDAVECNGQGALLRDAVEADSLLRVLRNEIETPLPLTAVKSRMGYATECAGVASLHRLILAGMSGVLAPNNHLHQLNPHLHFDNKAALLTEPVETAMASSYMGVQSHGFGGTQVHVIAYGLLDPSRTMPAPAPRKQSYFNFWPGGGGELEEEQLPSRGYYIAGSWTKWRAIKMENEGGDTFGYTLTLGENRWEEFQIYLDGDEKRRLHPEQPRASKGVAVQGPDSKARGLNWRIEGRGQWLDVSAAALQAVSLGHAEETSKAIEAISSGLRDQASSEHQLLEFGSGDVGLPGEKYRIRLRVAGRYRTVLWEKLPGEDHDTSFEAPLGDYCVAASWNGWSLDPMSLRNDTWSIEVELPCDSGEFQIIRNEDWSQVIAPRSRLASQTEPGQGPEHCSQVRGCSWCLNGRRGDVFGITFKREMVKQPSGKLEDLKKVSWQKLREGAAPRPMTGFGVMGSWNGFGRVHKLQSSAAGDQTVYSFLVEVGRDGYESFQFVQDFDWSRVVHPDRPVTIPGSERRILVSQMESARQDLVWALGVEKPNSTGDVYKVELLAKGESVLSVSWHQLDDVPKGREVLGV